MSAMATEPAIGTRIARRRHVLGWTQKELADRLGVSKSAVANWERGKNFPRRHLGRVEYILGIDLDDRDELALSPELRSMIDNLTDGERELVMAELSAADRRLSGRGGGDPRPGGQRRAG
jgi:transcriptional regulator with XRE-family HTH domain